MVFPGVGPGVSFWLGRAWVFLVSALWGCVGPVLFFCVCARVSGFLRGRGPCFWLGSVGSVFPRGRFVFLVFWAGRGGFSRSFWGPPGLGLGPFFWWFRGPVFPGCVIGLSPGLPPFGVVGGGVLPGWVPSGGGAGLLWGFWPGGCCGALGCWVPLAGCLVLLSGRGPPPWGFPLGPGVASAWEVVGGVPFSAGVVLAACGLGVLSSLVVSFRVVSVAASLCGFFVLLGAVRDWSGLPLSLACRCCLGGSAPAAAR